MPQRSWVLAFVAMVVFAATAVGDDLLVPPEPVAAETAATVRIMDKDSTSAPQPPTKPNPVPEAEPTVWYEYPDWLPPALTSERRDVATRFGWWYADQVGAKNKVGEWQGLDNSPFLDVDALFSDGNQTADFSGSGLDNDTSSGRLNYYGPKVSATVEYDRFIHRLDHDPLYGKPWDGTPTDPSITAADNVVTQDLNLGKDYAIRVQELKSSVKGQLGDHVTWRLNVWGMRKSGERQANATGHCFDLDPAFGSQQNKCHVLSQQQQIDWQTMEIEPVIAARFDNFTAEYSRTWRSFAQNDQLVDRTYTRFGYSPSSGEGGPPFEYAVVPESLTQIDKLKLSAHVTEDNELYAYLYNGDTENKFRDTHRDFNGFDARLTNRSIDNVSVTSYVKQTNETNQLPPFLLVQGTAQEVPADIRHPIDYSRTRVGVKGRWRPFYDRKSDGSDFDPWRYLALTSGYEYYVVERDFATYSSTNLGTFTQPDTKRHELQGSVDMPLSPTVDSFVRYKARFAADPLIGVDESTGRFNTNQPEQEHGVDLGGSWNPAQNFMATAQFSFVNRWNDSFYPSLAVTNKPIHFTENDYPIVCTVWYAPTDQWSLSGGYAYYSNWIDQDITTGFRVDETKVETSRWDFAGQNHVVNFNSNYALTPRVRLQGGCEWDSGSNTFSVPPSTTGADWSQLGSYSQVVVQTMRYNAGIDYRWRNDVTLYFRYNFFDYEDKNENIDSGTVHYVLAGLSAIY